MAKVIDKSVVKRIVLELLEEDEEFRLAVAAKVGLLEILQKLEEHDRKFNEILERLDKHEEELKKIWSEIKKIWEKLEEHDRKFNEILAELREHRKILERHEKKLEEHDRKLNEIISELKEHREILERHEKILMEHSRKLDEHSEKLNRMEVELGALTESFYCRTVWDDLREEITGRGEKILVRARNYRVDEADIDLFIETSKTVYVVEVKVKPKHGDVNKLINKADIVRKHYPGKEVVPVLAGALIGREIQEYARSKGVKVYVY